MSEENNHIEKFFRKHLDVEQSSFMEEDWAQMESKLDEAGLGVPPANTGGIGMVKGVVILFLASTIAFLLGWYLRPVDRPPGSTEQVSAERPQQPAAAKLPDVAIIQKETDGKVSANSSLNERAGKDQHKLSAQEEYVIKNESQNPADEIPPTDHSSREPALHDQTAPPEVLAIRTLQGGADRVKHELKYPAMDISLLSGQFNCPSAPKMFRLTDWSIGIAAAPDINSLDLKGKQRITGKIGLRLYWDLMSRVSLQTGVFYNQKQYTSTGNEYNPPPGYWDARTNGEVPSVVEGSCRVVDIPVMITYEWLQQKKWSLLASAGLSNYLLLDEEYYYDFDNNNPGADESWVTDENENAGWSIANLSIAGAYQWRPNTSLVIEPFIQAPLRQIGWADVSLYGYGVLFTIKHDIKFKGF